MAHSSRAIRAKRFTEYFGVDRRSSAIMIPENFAESMVNLVFTKTNEWEKRKGFKAIALGSGGFGYTVYNRFNSTTGAISTEHLSVSNTILKRATDTITIAYSGSNQCYLTFYFDTSSDQYKFKIVESTTTKLDYSVGNGFDEAAASTKTLADVKTQVDAISGGLFSATISGTTTTPAALLPLTESKGFNSSSSVAIAAYHWTSVNSPISNMMQWFEDNKNSEEFVNCVPIQTQRSVYFPNPTSGYGMMKYDGQNFYRAGLPQINQPTGVEINAAAGTAEETTIVCRAEAGIAEVVSLTTIADSSTKEISQFSFLSGGRLNYDGKYIVLYDTNGSVAVWFDSTGSTSQPSAGTTRYIEITLTGAGQTNLATQMASQLDADSQFVASSSSGTVTITDASVGIRQDITQGTVDPAIGLVSTIIQGTNGLQNKFFILRGDDNEQVAFWYNIGSGGTQPSAGADRYVAITTVTSGMSANDVAIQTELSIEADDFSSSAAANVITITCNEAEERSAPSAGDSGFTISVTTEGVDSIHEKYFTLYDDSNDSVAFWYDVTGSGVEPSHGASRSVEITTVTAGNTAAQVATATEAFIEADEWSSSVATATITATANNTGSKTDASAGTSGFTVTVTAQGLSSGIGTGTFLYKITAIQRDNNGVIYEGNPIEDNLSVTTSASTKDIRLTIQTIQPTTGYNTNCAIVNGSQSSVTTITVDSGHTIKAGDQAYLLNRADGTYVTRSVSSITSTTVVVDQAVSVTDNDVISNGLKLGIYRTTAGGAIFYLVAEIPNNSIDGSLQYTDTMTDAILSTQAIYETPAVDRSPPGSFKFLTLFRNVGVATGFLDDPSRVSYSDIESIEYWPVDSNEFSIETIYGDRSSAATANNEAAILGKLGPENKGGSIHVVSGELDENLNFALDTRSKSLGISSQSSIVEIHPGAIFYVTPKGPYIQMGNDMPRSISGRIEPVFTNQVFSANTSLHLERSTAINDSDNERVILFLPVEPDSGTKYANSASQVWIFDYSLDKDGNPQNRWFQWDAINAACGFSKVGDDIFFIERRLSSFTGLVSTNLYQFHTTGTASDYQDHTMAIVPYYLTRWEDFGEPNIYKIFTILKTLSMTSFPYSFVINIEIEYDFIEGSIVTTDSITINGTLNDAVLTKLKNDKAFAVRIKFSNSEEKKNILLTGYELQAVATYNEAIVE